MDDIAARAGVSRTLVSFVLAGKAGAGESTRLRVLQIAEELGYKPDTAAQLLARGRSRTLGVMIDLRQPFQAELATSIYPLAEAAGYSVLLSVSAPGRDEAAAIESLLGHRCEGLVLLGPASDRDYLERLEERAVVVVIGRPLPPGAFDSVRSADDSGIRQSVDHLVGLGHRVIHHIGGGSDPGAAIRSESYVAAMRDHGLDDHVRVIGGAYDEAAGAAAGRAMLAEGSLPTAVLAGNDRCALGLMDVMDRAGVSVPDDLSIVGFDDTEMAGLSRVDLTTVRQDVAGLAEHAVEHVVARLADESVGPSQVVVDTRLVVRGSTGAPRSSERDDALWRRRRTRNL